MSSLRGVISILAKVHMASLKPFEEFPQMAELEELAKAEKMSNEMMYYNLAGYKSRGGYKVVEVYKMRKMAAMYKFEELMEFLEVKSHVEMNKLLGKAKAVPSIVKKGSIPEDIIDEVRVLSSHFRHEASYHLTANGKYLQLPQVLASVALTQKEISRFSESFTEYFAGFIQMKQGDRVAVENFTLYTPNYSELSERLLEIVKWSLISLIIPISYMDYNMAIKFAEIGRGYFFDPFDKYFLVLMDYLHMYNVTVDQVFDSMGVKIPDILTNYERVGAVVLQMQEDVYTVMNHNSGFRLSKAEFTSCIERDILPKLVIENGAVKVDLGKIKVPLEQVGGIA